MAERLNESLAAVLADRFGLCITHAEPVRGLGDECDVWRTAESRGLAIRVSPPTRSVADLEWVYRSRPASPPPYPRPWPPCPDPTAGRSPPGEADPARLLQRRRSIDGRLGALG